MSYELSQSQDQVTRQAEYARLFAQARDQYPDVVHALRRQAEGHAVADIGCGPGASLRLLRRAGFTSIFGIDADRPALGHAGRIARKLRVDFVALPSDLGNGIDALPAGIVSAALATNVAIHVGYPVVFAAAARVLSPGGTLAVHDRDYARMEAWNLPALERLLSLVRQIVARDDRDAERAEVYGVAHGFTRRAYNAGRCEEPTGRHVLQAFSFIETMNGSGEALALKAALRELANDADLASARLRVVDKWTVYRHTAGIATP